MAPGASIRPCGLVRRLLAITYDTILVLALLFLAAALALPLGSGGQQALRDPWFTLYLAAVWFLYEAWCWRKAGMTLGMRAWRVRLLVEGGGRLSWGRCLARFIVGLVSFAALGAGFLWALADPARRTWHDLASGSRLVRWHRGSD